MPSGDPPRLGSEPLAEKAVGEEHPSCSWGRTPPMSTRPADVTASSAQSDGTPPFRTLREVVGGGRVPVARNHEWVDRFPWLVHGITWRGAEGGTPFDLALFGAGDPGRARRRWHALGRETGLPRMVHGRQVHGAEVRLHEEGRPGLAATSVADGHITGTPGVLLGVTVADCVPVLVVDPARRAVAVLHAGWRGVAAGVLEAGLGALTDRLASRWADLHVHLGPAICGACYEVGPEVHEALGLPVPGEATPVDLRGVLARRAANAGVGVERITVSTWCTRCDSSPFFSHRGGDPERQVAFAGIRP